VTSRPCLLLACPTCKGPLDAEGPETLLCPTCRSRFPRKGGVVDFSGSPVSPETASTVAQFGASWSLHDHLEDYYERQFLDWISPLDSAAFEGRDVLEAGCGKGRHTRLAASWGARSVYGVDLSEAVFLAERATRDLPNVTCVRGDLLRLPFDQASFDLAFCVGVLHHLEDPRRGLGELWRVLKPGGTLSLWVYGREGNGWIVCLLDPLRKGVTSRIPTPVLRPLALPLSALLFVLLKGLYGPATRWGQVARWWLPYSAYLGYISRFPFREVDSIVLDHLCPPIAHYLRRETLEEWLADLGAAEVRLRWHNRNSWAVLARKG